MKPYISINSKPTGVPYRRSLDDSNSHSYVRLKGNLELIDELPECVRDKALHDCVWHLNRPESVLETIGFECAMNLDKDVPTEHGLEPEVFRKKGYIGMIFSDFGFGANPSFGSSYSKTLAPNWKAWRPMRSPLSSPWHHVGFTKWA